jgi:hypothetical protein
MVVSATIHFILLLGLRICCCIVGNQQLFCSRLLCRRNVQGKRKGLSLSSLYTKSFSSSISNLCIHSYQQVCSQHIFLCRCFVDIVLCHTDTLTFLSNHYSWRNSFAFTFFVASVFSTVVCAVVGAFVALICLVGAILIVAAIMV